MLPQSDTTVEALRSREFVVVVDSFMTDTARLAHLVLPTTTLLESDDLLGSYGHHWIGVSTPVVPPPSGVKSDLEIIQGIAQRVGLGDVMAGTAREWKERILKRQVKEQGITIDALEKGPLRNPLPEKILFADRRFPTPSGRVNLMTVAPASVSAGKDYPLFLMSLSTEKAQSSQWALPQEGHAEVVLHPSAAGDISDGQLATLQSRVGAMTVRVRHDPQQRSDIALMAKGGHWHGGRCANSLVSAATSDIGDGGALYDENVRIVRM
jgi:anaerobic selenocysteine-containing dehydrogenase